MAIVVNMSARPRDEFDTTVSADDFVGRRSDVDALITLLLRNTRLVTLLGPGGIGKTRLATEACERLRDTPVYWARLAHLPARSDAETVAEEIARSVVTTDFSGRRRWDALVATLTGTDRGGRSRPLLVLDNCEHVLPGVGRVVTRLLTAIPRLRVLATSREAIDWVDEYRFEVPPLSADQALELFRRRAELTGHPVVSAEERALAVRICRQMDHHPLYIRLAAGRLVRQPLAQIARQLDADSGADRRLDWIPGPALGAEARHRSINDVVSWSYDLCGEKEKLLFDRMAVFATGYDTTPNSAVTFDVGTDLEAIRAVCADPEAAGPAAESGSHAGPIRLGAGEIEAALERLADQSLVSRHIGAAVVTYSLSENLRVYAQQRLRERSAHGTDEAARCVERHRNYYRDKVLHAAASYFGPAERELLAWAMAAWNNIVIALDRSLAPGGDAAQGLEICVGLLILRLPFFKGSFREMRLWTERALAATGAAASPRAGELRVTAMSLLVWILLCQGQTGDAERLLDECVRECAPEPAGDWRREPDHDLGLPAVVDFAWGVELFLSRKDPVAVAVLDRAREKFARAGNTSGAIPSEQFAALAAVLLGPLEQARELARRYLEHTATVGISWTRLWAELTWSIVLTRLGRAEEALELQRSVLANVVASREQWAALWAVQFRAWSLARLIADSGAARAAGRNSMTSATEIALLAGGARTLRAGLGVEISRLGPFDDIAAEAVRVARDVLGRRAFENAEKRGATMRPELQEVHRLAMGASTIDDLPPPPGEQRDLPREWYDLTRAEQAVARLAAAGCTNSVIAARRGTSRRTVDAQMSTIFQKLRITSRGEIAEFLPEEP